MSALPAVSPSGDQATLREFRPAAAAPAAPSLCCSAHLPPGQSRTVASKSRGQLLVRQGRTQSPRSRPRVPSNAGTSGSRGNRPCPHPPVMGARSPVAVPSCRGQTERLCPDRHRPAAASDSAVVSWSSAARRGITTPLRQVTVIVRRSSATPSSSALDQDEDPRRYSPQRSRSKPWHRRTSRQTSSSLLMDVLERLTRHVAHLVHIPGL